MNKSDYLWDKSGSPDPEIQRLEQVLGVFGHRQASKPVVPSRHWRAAAIAASVMIGISLWQLSTVPGQKDSRWWIAAVEGAPQVDAKLASLSTTVRQGQSLRTDKNSSLQLQAGNFGMIDVAPESELKVLESKAAGERLGLRHGTIHAFIWAVPGQFQVDTASSRAIDLGCQYTLRTDPAGNGLLTVQTGWVAFEFHGRESFIPAGAACVTRAQRGPGTPYFQNAPEELRDAIREYDDSGSQEALQRILALARPADGLSLWHLLTSVPEAQRGMVFDRFASLVPMSNVERERVLRLDRHEVDRCWDALKLQDTNWWRGWKRQW